MQCNEIPCNTMKYPGTFGTKSGPPGHSEHHRDPQKGHFGPNGPFWAPGGQAEARYQFKMCGDHESDQPVAFRTKTGNPRPSE